MIVGVAMFVYLCVCMRVRSIVHVCVLVCWCVGVLTCVFVGMFE